MHPARLECCSALCLLTQSSTTHHAAISAFKVAFHRRVLRNHGSCFLPPRVSFPSSLSQRQARVWDNRLDRKPRPWRGSQPPLRPSVQPSMADIAEIIVRTSRKVLDRLKGPPFSSRWPDDFGALGTADPWTSLASRTHLLHEDGDLHFSPCFLISTWLRQLRVLTGADTFPRVCGRGRSRPVSGVTKLSLRDPQTVNRLTRNSIGSSRGTDVENGAEVRPLAVRSAVTPL
jgi:hypothetical protein